MVTAKGEADNTHDLVADTAAVVDAFRGLADAAAELVAQGDALRHQWASLISENLLCEWGQQPAEVARFDELTDWIERARRMTALPPVTLPIGRDAASTVVGDHGPGYFVG